MYQIIEKLFEFLTSIMEVNLVPGPQGGGGAHFKK
jgi:hypothetical protein